MKLLLKTRNNDNKCPFKKERLEGWNVQFFFMCLMFHACKSRQMPVFTRSVLCIITLLKLSYSTYSIRHSACKGLTYWFYNNCCFCAKIFCYVKLNSYMFGAECRLHIIKNTELDSVNEKQGFITLVLEICCNIWRDW